MAERYTRIFTLPEQHLENAPIQIQAGALQKDNRNGHIFAQLKLISASSHPLRTVNVQIQPLDTYGQSLRTVCHSFPVPVPGIAFGHQELIPMPADTASFAVSFTVEQLPYAAAVPQPAAPTAQSPLFMPAPISKLLRFLPLVIAAVIILLDPLVYLYQMGVFSSHNGSKYISMIFNAYFSNVFYTDFILLITPTLFVLLCYVRELRVRFLKAFSIVFLVILGLQVLMALLNFIILRSDTDPFALRNLISYFPGAWLLRSGYSLLSNFHIRILINFIWEVVYFVPGILALLFTRKLSR